MNITERDRKYIRDLCEIAISTEHGDSHKMAACIVHNGNIISIGYNRRKTHPLQNKFKKNEASIYLHAEIHAIAAALRRHPASILSRSDLYIARVKKPNGDPDAPWIDGLSHPCPGCMRAIVEFGFRKVVYTTDTLGEYGILAS